jgi:ABC-type antimicrobial peptide transport system permease subunit
VGASVGLALFVGFARLLRSLTYQVGALDPAALAFAAALVVGIATAAAFIPARRAASIDPADALRAE